MKKTLLLLLGFVIISCGGSDDDVTDAQTSIVYRLAGKFIKPNENTSTDPDYPCGRGWFSIAIVFFNPDLNEGKKLGFWKHMEQMYESCAFYCMGSQPYYIDDRRDWTEYEILEETETTLIIRWFENDLFNTNYTYDRREFRLTFTYDSSENNVIVDSYQKLFDDDGIEPDLVYEGEDYIKIYDIYDFPPTQYEYNEDFPECFTN